MTEAAETGIPPLSADPPELERHGIADSVATEDLRRGVTALLAGEQPEFTGE